MRSYSELIASTVMARYPDPDDYPYRSWCYPQGFMLSKSLVNHTKSGVKASDGMR